MRSHSRGGYAKQLAKPILTAAILGQLRALTGCQYQLPTLHRLDRDDLQELSQALAAITLHPGAKEKDDP